MVYVLNAAFSNLGLISSRDRWIEIHYPKGRALCGAVGLTLGAGRCGEGELETPPCPIYAYFLTPICSSKKNCSLSFMFALCTLKE